ncbi:hypothetical protein N6H14_28305 [Paenibacillus sp. CC-CFT747]|nr:hypothetical protein N6H14_28305 [Paenibacillus sp. CC-CFT747]
MLGEDGEGFIRWACEEMTAWGRTAFRERDCSYVPMLTDGYSLEGLVLDRKGYFGPAGTVFRAMPLSGDDFWLYAYGYRLSKDPFLWEMARSIAKGIGLGELGSPKGEGRSLRNPGPAGDYRVLYALLDLYRATEDRRFLETAAGLGEGMAESCLNPSGATQAGETILTDHPLPLALLHLADAWEGRASTLRPAWK